MNPGAFELPGNGIDEDCDGLDTYECDDDVGSDFPEDAYEAARAMGLCQRAAESDRRWGVLSARFTRADGEGEPHEIQIATVDSLGVARPQLGRSMVSVSNGVATELSRLGSRCEGAAGITPVAEDFPPGFPVESPACPDVVNAPVFTSAALEVRLRVPTNAAGYRIGSNFFTREYPVYICSSYNDLFAILEQRDGTWRNIAFDRQGNPISVNNALLEVCRPGNWGGREFECRFGPGGLRGTGFELDCTGSSIATRGVPGAATGWLCTDVPTLGGEEITLRFAVWNAGDEALSSLALIDGFAWLAREFESVTP